jgi:DNA-binding transcriptional MerR regulator
MGNLAGARGWRLKISLDHGIRSAVYNELVATQATGREFFRSGELAALAGVSKDTLRFYERAGLLAPPERLRNGYRRYSTASLSRVRLIRTALAVGFSIEELAGILAMRKRGEPPCRKVRELAALKLADIERALSELSIARDRLRRLLGDWDRVLAGTAADECAGLLESLAKSGSAINKNALGPRSRRPGRTKKPGGLDENYS